jgi:hypothetical protein
MKLSDAILLGSTMIKPLAGKHLSPDGDEGCAWGMVDMATGGRAFRDLLVMAANFLAELPCGCTDEWIIGSGMNVQRRESMNNLSAIIVHLFNYHVMTRKDWTLERLVDWVRSVEPAEPEEKELEKREVQEVIEVT